MSQSKILDNFDISTILTKKNNIILDQQIDQNRKTNIRLMAIFYGSLNMFFLNSGKIPLNRRVFMKRLNTDLVIPC